MKMILFQGDSITEAQRKTSDPFNMGAGYAVMAAGILGCEFPGRYDFLNRGVSGNKSNDVLARTKEDIIDIRPDVMSLLIGVNDVWHEIDWGASVGREGFTRNVSEIVERTLTALPDCKIMLLEPFVFKEYATVSTEKQPDRWQRFETEVRHRAELTGRIAEKYSLTFVPLWEKLQKLTEETEVRHWSEDGVHLLPCGHLVVAKEWVKAFKTLGV